MGRPRGFSEAAVIERAMAVFWERGYDAASLPQLLARMGLTRGSFYKAFKGKRAVYLAALAHYDASVVGPVIQRLENRDGGAGPARIAGLFRWLAKIVDGPDARKGCFLCKAAVDRAPHDAEVERAVAASIARLAAAFQVALLDRGIAMTRRRARETANCLAANYLGIQVMRNATGNPTAIKSAIAQTLKMDALQPA